jgi:transposase
MAGRKPIGPPLVHHLDGSKRAKERLEVILETVAGSITIREACDRLGIEEAMFFRLRTQSLQAGLSRLEPRPMGRPPRSRSTEDERIAELEQELQEKELEQKALQTRLEIAQVMSPVETAPKKTAKRKPQARELAKGRRRTRRRR